MSTSTYEVSPSCRGDADYIAYWMRKADLIEVSAHKKSPKQAILEGLQYSKPHAWTVHVDGKPSTMFGAVPIMGTDWASPWLLGTDDILKIRWRFLRESRFWLRTVAQNCSVLFNVVHEKNKLHHRWLRWLGFEFGRREPPFIHFHKILCVAH